MQIYYIAIYTILYLGVSVISSLLKGITNVNLLIYSLFC
jgi:hypothetical protein